ncbi:MAG TPA: PVC-type heme-binding CxxCH protein, partial [Verrucomicrobiae bacterium]
DNIGRAVAGEPIKPLTPQHVVPNEPPPTPPQTPAEELATLKVNPDYELNLFASEADGVVKALQIRWDERGRLWVLCPASYPQLRPGEKANDRIVICEDSNGDGRADVFTVFADGLNMPTGFELGDGGVYVTQGTDLWFLRDTDGDGKADVRRLVLGGFGTGDSHQMINCLSWGFGGELWFTQGHHIWSRVETPYGVEHLNRSGVWRVRPRTLRMDSFFQMSSAGANCWGVMTDEYGQVFHKTGADNGGFYSVPGLIRTDLPLPSEVLRLFQARLKTVGFDFIHTRHFPDDLQGTVAIGGFYDNTLQLHKLDYRDGVFSSQQIATLVETTNKVFRPVDVRVGPDGAIYFADWYNPIIGHYQASYRHPDRDQDHGRVWRLKRKDRELVKPAWFPNAKTETLFAQLDSPERWAKYQAKRLLFERDTKEVIAALDRWVKTLKPGDAHDEYLRLEALSLFEAHETPRPDLLKTLLRSPDFRVRAYATRALSNWARQGAIPDALKLLEPQVADEHPRVRLEAVVASSYLDDPAAVTIAARVLDRPMDKYLDYALAKTVHALRPHWEPLLSTGRLNFSKDEHLLFVLKDARLDNAPALIRRELDRLGNDATKSRPWLLALAAVGDANDLQLVLNRAGSDAALLDALANSARARKAIPAGDHAAFVTRLLDASSNAERQRGVKLAGLWNVKSLNARIQSIAGDNRADLVLRTDAFEALAGLSGKEALPLLQRAFNQASSPEIALAALESIARLHQGIAANLTLGRLKTATNGVEAGLWLRPLLTRATGAGALANAL